MYIVQWNQLTFPYDIADIFLRTPCIFQTCFQQSLNNWDTLSCPEMRPIKKSRYKKTDMINSDSIWETEKIEWNNLLPICFRIKHSKMHIRDKVKNCSSGVKHTLEHVLTINKHALFFSVHFSFTFLKNLNRIKNLTLMSKPPFLFLVSINFVNLEMICWILFQQSWDYNH